MVWERFEHMAPLKEELKRLTGRVQFYADQNLDESIVLVLRKLGLDVGTARDIGAETQPDEFHYKRAFTTKRVLLTQDKDYLDNARFPLSQTRGVIIFNVDTASTRELGRAIEVINTIFADSAPVLDETKVILNADYTLTMVHRVATDEGYEEDRTRYRFDTNGDDLWVWVDDN